jgi:hypothetical protein
MGRTTSVHTTIIAIIVMIAICTPGATLQAQDADPDADPFTVEQIDRYRAELPTPFGAIVTKGWTVVKYAARTADIRPRLGVDLYYDTWQLGLNRREYGDFVSLYNRTSGRDAYIGWFIEVGSIEKEDRRDTQNVSIGMVTQYGLGVEGGFGFAEHVVGTFNYRLAVGLTGYALIEIGGGLRIPVDVHGIRIGVKAFGGLSPSRLVSSDPPGVVGITGVVSIALNGDHY